MCPTIAECLSLKPGCLQSPAELVRRVVAMEVSAVDLLLERLEGWDRPAEFQQRLSRVGGRP